MNRRLASVLLLFFVVGTTWACASTARSGSDSSGVSLSADSYSAEDLADAPYATLYEFLNAHNDVRVGQTGAVDALGVRYRGQFVTAALYIGGSEIGSPISRLRQITPQQVEQLDILNPSEASSRYGASGGIIDLRLQ